MNPEQFLIDFLPPFLLPLIYFIIRSKKEGDSQKAYSRLFQLSIVLAFLIGISRAAGAYSVRADSDILRLITTLTDLIVPVAYVLAITFLAWKAKIHIQKRVYQLNAMISVVVLVAGWSLLMLLFSMSSM